MTGCGAIDRQTSRFPGQPSKVCVDGVTYLQFTSGATVQVDLDLAWNMTNSIDCPWYEYEGVLNFKGMAEAEGRCRSAMVGDIYVLNGKAYVITPVGFNQIGDDDCASSIARKLEQQY